MYNEEIGPAVKAEIKKNSITLNILKFVSVEKRNSVMILISAQNTSKIYKICKNVCGNITYSEIIIDAMVIYTINSKYKLHSMLCNILDIYNTCEI